MTPTNTTGRVAEVDRGFDFADRLYALCHEHGPSDFASNDKEALASFLIDRAVEFVVAVNRAAKTEGQS